jgi:hypothetical protein
MSTADLLTLVPAIPVTPLIVKAGLLGPDCETRAGAVHLISGLCRLVSRFPWWLLRLTAFIGLGLCLAAVVERAQK